MDHEFPYDFPEQPPKDRGFAKDLYELVTNLAHKLAEAFNPSPIF